MAQRVPSNRNVNWLPLQSNDNAPPGPFAARPVKRISGESAGVNTGPSPAARSGPAGEEQQGENQFFHRFILFSARYVFPKRSRAMTSTRRVPAGSGAA